MGNKNKPEGKSFVYATFVSYLVDVPFKSWWIDIGASVTNLLQRFERGPRPTGEEADLMIEIKQT